MITKGKLAFAAGESGVWLAWIQTWSDDLCCSLLLASVWTLKQKPGCFHGRRHEVLRILYRKKGIKGIQQKWAAKFRFGARLKWALMIQATTGYGMEKFNILELSHPAADAWPSLWPHILKLLLVEIKWVNKEAPVYLKVIDMSLYHRRPEMEPCCAWCPLKRPFFYQILYHHHFVSENDTSRNGNLLHSGIFLFFLNWSMSKSSVKTLFWTKSCSTV